MRQERGKQLMYLVPKTFLTNHETLPIYHTFSQFHFSLSECVGECVHILNSLVCACVVILVLGRGAL